MEFFRVERVHFPVPKGHLSARPVENVASGHVHPDAVVYGKVAESVAFVLSGGVADVAASFKRN